MRLKDSSTLVLKSLKRPQYVNRQEDFVCPQKLANMYKAVQNNQPVAEHAIDSPACDSQDSVEPNTNLYEAAWIREVDFQLSQDSINSLKGIHFTWSLLSTDISYITHTDTLTSFSLISLPYTHKAGRIL